MAQVAARDVMPKRKRRRRVEEEYVQYVVTVTGWEHFYSFSIGNRSRCDIGPYHELATLDLKGDVIRPEGFTIRTGARHPERPGRYAAQSG